MLTTLEGSALLIYIVHAFLVFDIFLNLFFRSGESKTPPIKFRLRFSDLWQNPELYFTKMATSISGMVWAVPEFFLRKFPYVQALTLLMLLAERALKMEK